ncbi:MAG: hypothetical protein D6698_06705 [Gammaproteobacteria bacterium]|nr:MAG: hypothetical protein D6698_06705 [Gammaproteobacteria bacterium]
MPSEERRENKNILDAFTSGLGAIYLGSLAIRGYRSPLIADFLHYVNYGSLVGKAGMAPGRLIKRLAERSERGPLSSGSPSRRTIHDAEVDIRSQEAILDEPDLVKDVYALTEVQGALNSRAVANAYLERAKDYIYNKNSGHNYLSLFPHDLERVTIGEVLEDQKRWQSLIGKQSWDALFTAREKGWVKDELLLDPQIYRHRTSGRIVDTRIASRETVRRIFSIFDPFGQGRVVKSLLGANQRFAILPPPPGEARRGLQYFIGDTLYEAISVPNPEKGPADVFLKAVSNRPMKLREAQRDPLKLYSALRYGGAQVKDPEGGFFAKLQSSIGIGPAYRSRKSLIERFLIDPIKIAAGLETGEAVVYKRPFKYAAESVLGRTPAGAFFPEAFQRVTGGRVLQISGGGEIVDFNALPLKDRARILLGLHTDYEVLKKSAEMKLRSNVGTLNELDKYLPNPTGGIEGVDRAFRSTFSKEFAEPRLTGAGELSPNYAAKYYAAPKGVFPSVAELSSFLAHRVSSLTSELGLAAKPSGSPLVNIGRLIAIPIVGKAIVEAAGYADFAIEEITGVSPVKALATVYAEARVAQQKLREALGIRAVAGALESAYPGSVESEGATIFRTIGLPLLSFLGGLRRGGLRGALMGAGASYTLFGGVGLSQPSEELREEYEGLRKVPVRKGALWGFGYTPFFGSDVSYFTYSWYHKLMTDYRTKSIYGSRREYYSKYTNVFGIPFPTPHSLFGLRQILDPYALEEKHYYDRPYLETAGRFDELPIVGPILSWIDQHIPIIGKPIKRMHSGYLLGMPSVPGVLQDRSVPPSAARRLGIAPPEPQELEWEDVSDITARTRQLAAVATEPLGVYKFALQLLGVDLEGAKSYTAASAAAIGSTGREFYGLGLGGLFGLTEPVRRFLLPEFSTPYRLAQRFNPIRNTMPTFLPGVDSDFLPDRDYFIDFHTGDPFTKIPEGEARLPGAGYEALSPLHSGVSGVYDVIDKLLILSDVAPYSYAFLKTRKEVEPIMESLPEGWRKRVEMALAQRDAVVNQIFAYPRFEDRGVADLNEKSQIEGAIRDIISVPIAQQAWDVITHDVLAEIPYFGTKFFPFRDAIERYRKERIYGAEFADWRDPINTIIRPAAYDIADTNVLGAAAKGAFLGVLMSNPLTNIINPIAPLRSPSIAVPSMAAAATALSVGRHAFLDKNFIPPETEREAETFKYLDYLTYAKGRALQIAAEEVGDDALAKSYEAVARKTIVGAQSAMDIRSAMTTPDRRFLNAFLSYPESSRNRVIHSLPTYYAEALQKVWYNDYSSTNEADEETLHYFSQKPIPAEDSLVWHPSIPTAVMKIKVMEGGIGGVSDNLHRFGFMGSQIREARERFPDIHVSSVRTLNAPNFESFAHNVNHALRTQFPFDPNRPIARYHGNSSLRAARYEVTTKSDRTDRTYYYIQDLMR